MTKKSKDYTITARWFKGNRQDGKIVDVPMEMSITQSTEDLMSVLKELTDIRDEYMRLSNGTSE